MDPNPKRTDPNPTRRPKRPSLDGQVVRISSDFWEIFFFGFFHHEEKIFLQKQKIRKNFKFESLMTTLNENAFFGKNFHEKINF